MRQAHMNRAILVFRPCLIGTFLFFIMVAVTVGSSVITSALERMVRTKS